MENGKKQGVSLGKVALAACRAHSFELLLLLIGHIVVRAAAFSPILIWFISGISEDETALPGEIFAALTIALFCFLVLPMRFYAGEKLCAWAAGEKTEKGVSYYGLWLKAGLCRYGRGLLWGIPALAAPIAFVWAMDTVSFKALGTFVQKFAWLPGLPHATTNGLLTMLALWLIFLMVFIMGWLRDMPMNYLPVRAMGIGGMRRMCMKIRRNNQGRMLHNALWNLLLSLPALIGGLGVLIPYAIGNIRVVSNPLMTVKSALELMKNPLPLPQIAGLALVLVFLYLPFFVIRKMRNAALIHSLLQEENNHAAG